MTSGPSDGWGAEDDLRLPAVVWRKSSASMANGACVEVAHLPSGQVAVRDSKDKAGPVLCFSHDQWQGLLDAIKESRLPTS
jgi:Domain of unknown function (DUF397)